MRKGRAERARIAEFGAIRLCFLCCAWLCLQTVSAAADSYVELGLDTGATWHHQGAVDGAVRQFLGVDRSETDDDGTSGGTSGEILTPDSDAPFRSTTQWGLSAGLFHTQPLAPRLTIRAGVRLSLGQAEYYLKNGIAPFIDPITVSIDHASVTPEMAFSGALVQRGRWHLTAEAGTGLSLLRARTRISSALLDVRRTEDFRDLHVFGGLELGYGATVTNLRLRHSDRTGLHLTLGQVLRF